MAKAKRKRKRARRPSNIVDQYRLVQAQARKEANKARQEVLKEERADADGDPVLSKPTPFIESLRARRRPAEDAEQQRNYLLTNDLFRESLQYSHDLTSPLKPQGDQSDVEKNAYEEEKKRHDSLHANVELALQRITSLNNASSKDRTRMNIQRCIEEFGRHNTDSTIPPRPIGPAQTATPPPSVPRERVGPDTGSSEVQVAILTTKIDNLVPHIKKWGHKDKHNKRNLRLLVHRRQKLLAYLRQKERGGPRFTNLMEKLGLGDASWKGEISM